MEKSKKLIMPYQIWLNLHRKTINKDLAQYAPEGDEEIDYYAEYRHRYNEYVKSC